MLRKESEPQTNGQPLTAQSTEAGGAKYTKAFELLRKYTEDNLDLYRPELRKLLWPVFVYSFLDLVRDFYTKDAETFFAAYQGLFERDHDEDVKTLRQVRLQSHLQESRIAKLYLDNKYRITLTTMPFFNLIQFLESKHFDGGSTIIDVIREHLNIVTVDRTATAEKSIAAILASGHGDDELPAEDEGIPGHAPGHPLTARHDPEADAARIRLQLGAYPQEAELQDDVRAALQEEDAKAAPRPGQSSLLDEFEQRIKREPTEDVRLAHAGSDEFVVPRKIYAINATILLVVHLVTSKLSNLPVVCVMESIHGNTNSRSDSAGSSLHLVSVSVLNNLLDLHRDITGE